MCSNQKWVNPIHSTEATSKYLAITQLAALGFNATSPEFSQNAND